MLLKTWLDRRGMTMAELGRRSGLPRAMISRYYHGENIPRREAMQRIIKATGGQVKPADFYQMKNGQ